MDGVLLVLWIVRLLFLALLYVFLFRIVRTLLRDLRAAAREPGTAARAARRPRRRRAASRRSAARSTSTPSRRSAAT